QKITAIQAKQWQEKLDLLPFPTQDKGVARLPAQYFRAGVGAVIIDNNGLILALERADKSGAWQLPQGGIELDEEPIRAAIREIDEETGIIESDLELVDAYPEPLVYELPVKNRSEKTGRGQVQYWFLFRFHGNADNIHAKRGSEFKDSKWMLFQNLLQVTVDFRKPIYQKLINRFAPYIR
ncbi:MAG: RNA pyrophosphohydrolase, partial [Smithellaceae bacterium]